MSWSGFKKNVGRATTQVMMKTGQVERTTDRDYEVEERRFRVLESASLRLQKEAKGYLDSLRAMTASQMRIAETIDAFYGDSGAKDGVSRSYKQAVEDLDAETIKALDGPYRCVPRSLYKCVEDESGRVNMEVIAEIQKEMNGGRKKKSSTARENMLAGREWEEQCELMDYIYRTTVLEPINRFCAYFPDINECIKKRNHKMLDYDAMRSKVRKLTEKPDKDASKLPRTEKEAEMVGSHHSLHPSPFPANASTAPEQDTANWEEHTLRMPSPPKALQRPEIQKLKDAEKPRRVTSAGPSVMRRAAGMNSSTPSASSAGMMHLHRSFDTQASLDSRHYPRSTVRSSSTDGYSENASMSSASTNTLKAPGNQDLIRPPLTRARTQTPFFQPSELEEIMQPLKEEFVQKQTDVYTQAKAAYEQMNEQLTTELPQLIDLRVPYLDPSFEALVKIQLRFCAEAYSRMAQVQQYLDPSTRDQYASGDLDARVEDVLGQIRELSIAGTV